MGHLAQSKIPFIYNFSQVFSVSSNTSPIIFTSSHRPWFPNLSTGETRRPLLDSEPLYPVIVYEISYAHDVSWFLDNPELNWTPPRNLVDFIAKARYDKKALVYIGFGSITVPNPKLVTERLIRAVQKVYSSESRGLVSGADAYFRAGDVRATSKGSKSKQDDVVLPKGCSLVGFT